MHTRSIVIAALALAVLAAGPGCGGDNPALTAEVDDSSYRLGQQLEREGRWDEALAAYLRVISRRGDAAPESNLDAGLICLNHTQNPIFAIYHFSKYLELEPNSKKAGMVRGMIDSAKREFARTLPGQPMESVTAHLGLEDQVSRLQRENDELRAENAALRAGVTVPVTHSSTITLGAIPKEESAAEAPQAAQPQDASSAISLAPVAPGEGAAASAITDAPQEEPPSQQPAPKAASPAAGRHHTVMRGDTLFSLSLRYYGTRSKWRDIFAANRGVLASENSPLKIGVELKIP
jgi:phage tail protein X